jgi:hypothetical protein
MGYFRTEFCKDGEEKAFTLMSDDEMENYCVGIRTVEEDEDPVELFLGVDV